MRKLNIKYTYIEDEIRSQIPQSKEIVRHVIAKRHSLSATYFIIKMNSLYLQ